jgi:hypothetical protein
MGAVCVGFLKAGAYSKRDLLTYVYVTQTLCVGGHAEDGRLYIYIRCQNLKEEHSVLVTNRHCRVFVLHVRELMGWKLGPYNEYLNRYLFSFYFPLANIGLVFRIGPWRFLWNRPISLTFPLNLYS